MVNLQHEIYMTHALNLAKQGLFTVSPNPMVGCVIVKNNQVVGQGFHKKRGKPHAEIYALAEAKEEAKGAIAYISLEPCCHHGLTPPCTNALIRAGIKKVYMASLDPNPLVSGQGVLMLQKAGIEVEIGLKEKEATALNESFFYYRKHKRPFVMTKWAMSLDGKTVTHHKDSKLISGKNSVKLAHQLRNQVDALLVGANTAISDNPSLTVRFSGIEPDLIKHPTRIILCGHRLLPRHLRIFDSKQPAAKTLLVVSEETQAQYYQAWHLSHLEVLVLASEKGKINLSLLLDVLGKREITSLLVEGGMTVHEHFFSHRLVNKMHVYLASKLIASLEEKEIISITEMKNIGEDFYIQANLI